MKPNPNVLSVGDDYREWPRELWGSRDWERARAAERAQADRDALRPVPRDFQALPGPPVNLCITSLDAPPGSADRRRLGLSPRSPSFDERLRKLGIKPRR